ncbi:MAG: thiamine diphosphokinase [Candidatus Cryosericum sp.]
MPTAPTIVFAGGDPGSFSYLRSVDYSDAYLVAVDRGLAVMVELELIPDLFVGDCDSVAPEMVAGLDHGRTQVISLPVQKDVSDLEAAFDLLAATQRRGTVLVLAGLGGRLDHSLFNLQLAARRVVDFEGISFEDGRCQVKLLTGANSTRFALGMTVSFVPMVDEVELTLIGFKYPLIHALIPQGSTRTLSNITQDSIQQVIVDRGTVAMIAWKEPQDIA